MTYDVMSFLFPGRRMVRAWKTTITAASFATGVGDVYSVLDSILFNPMELIPVLRAYNRAHTMCTPYSVQCTLFPQPRVSVPGVVHLPYLMQTIPRILRFLVPAPRLDHRLPIMSVPSRSWL